MKIAHIEQIPIAMPLAKRYDNHAGVCACTTWINI